MTRNRAIELLRDITSWIRDCPVCINHPYYEEAEKLNACRECGGTGEVLHPEAFSTASDARCEFKEEGNPVKNQGND